MKHLALFITVLTVSCAEWIEIDWSKVRPIHTFDRYWAHIPDKLQYLRQLVPPIRMIDRQDATPGQFPYQAALILNFTDGLALCGGTILTKNCILTAAHCVEDVLRGTAIVGAHDIRQDEPTQQRIAFVTDGISMHSGFTRASLRNDIATVRLSRPMTFNGRVIPIRLPVATDIRTFGYWSGTVSGFGQTSKENFNTSTELMFVRKPILTNMECYRYWGNRIDMQNICLSAAGGPGACSGDSGGPLTVKSAKILQVGIVSFGPPGLCSIGKPSVFMRVTHFRNWIIRNSDL
ncbi:brachyurin-like [Armigeres subalbatus]|uniref:brachyurin-like n=1 Tax=Armigeres subalbatus TaxID=124917 RepID=UPI002ED4FBD7